MDVENEVKSAIEAQGKAFEEFKRAVDAKIEAAAKGKGTAEIEEKIEKTNAEFGKTLDTFKKAAEEQAKKIGQLETAARRPKIGPDGKAQPELSEDQGAYKAALHGYMRKGIEVPNLHELEQKALSVGSDPDGGYYVSPDKSGEMVKKIHEVSPIRQLASVQTISTNALEGPSRLNRMTASWVGEVQSRPTTSTPQIGKWSIPVRELYVFPEATQQMLDDSAVDPEAWLADEAALAFAIAEGTAFTTGTVPTQPRGFASYTTAATTDATRAWGTFEHIATGANGSFGTDPVGMNKLVDLIHAVKSAYLQGSVFGMNRVTLSKARQLKSASGGTPVWMPAMDLSAVLESPLRNGSGTLLGFPVVDIPDMATYSTTDALAVVFGNFRIGYKIVDRIGIRVLRDPFSNKPYVGFYTTKRVGGDVLNFECLKFLKFGTS